MTKSEGIKEIPVDVAIRNMKQDILSVINSYMGMGISASIVDLIIGEIRQQSQKLMEMVLEEYDQQAKKEGETICQSAT